MQFDIETTTAAPGERRDAAPAEGLLRRSRRRALAEPDESGYSRDELQEMRRADLEKVARDLDALPESSSGANSGVTIPDLIDAILKPRAELMLDLADSTAGRTARFVAEASATFFDGDAVVDQEL